MLDKLDALNRLQFERELDPEIESRIAQYEMAYRMQTSVPEVTDLSKEPRATFDLYGPDGRKPGTFAANCLLARRLAERGVRFIQLYHQGWDQHGDLPTGIRSAGARDRPGQRPRWSSTSSSAACSTTRWSSGAANSAAPVYSQGKLTEDDYGRDHHPRCFTIWLAGGGVKPGITYGRTDDYGYNIADDDGNAISPDKGQFTPGAVHVHDLAGDDPAPAGHRPHALTFQFQGRRFRLTDVHGHVVKDILT